MEQLSTDEQQLVQQLSQKEQQKAKYSFDDNFQRRILGLILTDNVFLIQARPLIEPEYFSNKTHVIICKELFKYFETYRNNPEPFILQKLVEDKIKEEKDAFKKLCQVEFETLYEAFVPSSNSRDILLDKILTFAKTQTLKIAISQSLDDMKRDPEGEETWNKIHERFRHAMTVNKSFDLGFEVFPKIDDFFAELSKEVSIEDKFTSGFKKIDNNLSCGGCRRGEIYSWIGMPGKGKSLCLVKAAVENVKQKKKVLYISLEQGVVDITKRFISQFAFVDHNQIGLHKEEVKRTLDFYMENFQGDKNRFIIKQFPSGQADVNDINAYLIQLELYGFKPDLLIVDYPGEMKDAPGLPTWESKYRIMRDLRGIAVEKNMCVFTAMQPNKNAAALGEAEFIDENTIGGSFDQFKPLDGLWSINQTNEETEAGFGRFFVVKHRSGKSKYSFTVRYDKKTLDINECSTEDYRKAMHHLSLSKAEAANIDGSSNSKKKTGKEIKLNQTEESDYAD